MAHTQYDTLFSQTMQLFRLMMHGPMAAHRAKHAHKDEPREGHGYRGQGRLLMLLLEQDGLAQRDIVTELDIRPSSAGELIDKLVQAELAERRQSDEDKRVMHVFLTDKGREEAQKALANREELYGDCFGALSADEQAQLSALQQKMIDSLKSKYSDIPAHGGFGHHGKGPWGRGHHGPHCRRGSSEPSGDE